MLPGLGTSPAYPATLGRMQLIPEGSARTATAGQPGPAAASHRRPAGPPAALPLRWALPAAAAGGLALAGAFPPAGFWPLAVAGPAVLALVLYRRSLRGSFAVGLAFGVAFFVPLLSWLVNVAWYAWAALAIAEAVIFALLTIGQRLLLRLPGWPVAVACWWVAAEAMRARWPYAFPWGRLAMSQAGAPTAGWAAIGGPPLLSFLVALAGAALAWAVLVLLSGADRPAGRRFVTAGLGVAGAFALALGGALLPVDQAGPGQRSAEVAAIQGDVPHARNIPGLLRASTVTQDHAAATEALARAVAAGQRPARTWSSGRRTRPTSIPRCTRRSTPRSGPRSAPWTGRCWLARCWRTRCGTPASSGCPAAGRSARTSSGSWCRSASTSRSAACSGTSRRWSTCSRSTSPPGTGPWCFTAASARSGWAT